MKALWLTVFELWGHLRPRDPDFKAAARWSERISAQMGGKEAEMKEKSNQSWTRNWEQEEKELQVFFFFPPQLP